MAQAYNKFWRSCVIIVFFVILVRVCNSRVSIRNDMTAKLSPGSIQTLQTEGRRSKRGAVVKDKKMIWDYGVVPYEIDTAAGFGFNKISEIMAAMRKWERFTCITFVERNKTEHDNYIQFSSRIDDGECDCCSYVGRIPEGGRQRVGVGGCLAGSITHELGHVIGFWHEHERPDRDDYIEIKEDNLLDIKKFVAGKMSPDEVDTLGQPYDHGSIMHYRQTAESKFMDMEKWIRKIEFLVGKKVNQFLLARISTILPKKGQNGVLPEIGQRERLSAIDIRTANKLYNCPECGRTYLDEEAAFSSPEYHSKSTNRIHICQWRITVKDGKRIRLNINDLDIFKSSGCKSNYVEVRDGFWHKSPLLGRFCGNNIPEHIESTGHRIIINYVSSHIAHRGFAAKYHTL